MNMKTIKFALLPMMFLLWSIFGNPQTASAQSRWGFVWANIAAPAIGVPYVPSATYAFNSSGGGVSITRTGAGLYTVTFFGLGAGISGPSLGGNVQVTGYGPAAANNTVAKVLSWDSLGINFVVNVRTQSGATGGAVNALFTVLVMAP